MMTEKQRGTRNMCVAVHTGAGQTYYSVLSEGQDQYVIGRHDTGSMTLPNLILNDRYVSRQHCVIIHDSRTDEWLIKDLNSCNGTYVNGKKLPRDHAAPINQGTTIQVGETLLVFTVNSPIETVTRSGEETRVEGTPLKTIRLPADSLLDKVPGIDDEPGATIDASGHPNIHTSSEAMISASRTHDRLSQEATSQGPLK